MRNKLNTVKVLDLEPTNYCNLRCIMCHVRFMKDIKINNLDIAYIKKISNNISNCIINIGAVFEPTIHKDYSEIIKLLATNNNKLILITNATKIEENLIAILKRSNNIYLIQLSMDSIVKSTYEKIRVNGKFEVVSKNIKKISQAVKKKNTYLVINMTLMRSNINELIEMIDYCEENNIHKLNLIFMVIRDTTDLDLINESLYPIRNKAYNLLDNAAEYVIKNKLKTIISSSYYINTNLRMQYPNNFEDNTVFSDNNESSKYIENISKKPQKIIPKEMKIECGSPWNSARISWNGNVELCYKFIIGNIKDDTLENIYNSDKANELRNKIINDVTICENHDYYRFCLYSNKLNLDNIENFFSMGVLNKIDRKTLWRNYEE